MFEPAARPSPLDPPHPGEPGEIGQWTRLFGAAKSVAIAAAANQNRPVVVIASDTATATRFEREIAFFAPELPRYAIPDWETLPYDRFSPYQDINFIQPLTSKNLPLTS